MQKKYAKPKEVNGMERRTKIISGGDGDDGSGDGKGMGIKWWG